MQWLKEMATNPYALTALGCWGTAQLIKLIINLVVHRKFVWERIFGDGGMPSGHSATVTGLATMIGLREGFGTVAFAISLILCIVVCHDAMGVRQETGKQAMMLNGIARILGSEDLPEIKLKELVGHTPLQVVAGVLLGLGAACLMHFVILG